MKILFILAALMSAFSLVAAAQQAKPQHTAIPAAPIPPAIAAAKTVFLSNVCELPYTLCAPIYNQLYDGISKQGKYQIVASPDAADLIFEIRYSVELSAVYGSYGSTSSSSQSILRLKIVDRPTQVALWMITEPESNRVTAVDATMLDLAVLSRPNETAGPIVDFTHKK